MINQKLIDKYKKNFYENGFCVVKNAFSKKSISVLRKEINKIKKPKSKKAVEHLTKDKKVNTIHHLDRYLKKKNILVKFAKNKNLNKIVSNILNNKVKVRNIELFLKPKKTGMMSPFHQDNYYWNITNNNKALNLWLACTESSKKNGAVIYFQKSHKLGILNHEISYAAGSSQKVPDKIINKLKLKKVTPKLNPGDFIIHHSAVIHGSKKNISNKSREGLVISFKTVDAKINKRKMLIYRKKVKESQKRLNSLH